VVEADGGECSLSGLMPAAGEFANDIKKFHKKPRPA
jgi:hypothetical protein